MSRSPAAPAPWARERLVMCHDGPRSGAWYTLEGPGGWKDLRRLAELHGETFETGRTLGYIATRDVVPHPREALAEGVRLVWNPDMAARISSQNATPTG